MGTPLPVIPRPTKIALVGFASNTRDEAPYKDTSWEIWGLNNLWSFIPRFDRWFETHDPAQLENLYGKPYVDFLKGCAKPVYMQKHYDEFPASVELPRTELANKIQAGREFWPSSISYMAALAIDLLSGEDGLAIPGAELALYGIDLLGEDEYTFQREGCGYLIGVAEGRKIKVTIPQNSSLLKAAYIYGYESGEYSPDQFETFLLTQAAMYNNKQQEVLSMVHTYDGAKQAFQNALTMYKHNFRGGALAGGVKK